MKHSSRCPLRRALSPLLLGLLLTTVVTAEEEEAALVTDRPDQTESTHVIAAGSAQVEIGTAVRRDADGNRDIEIREAFQTLVRFGLGHRVELRLGWSGEIHEEMILAAARSSASGAGDADVGFKIGLGRTSASGRGMAMLLSTTLPTAAQGFGSDRLDPAIRLALSHPLSPTIDIGYNVGLATSTEHDELGERDTLASSFYTVAVGLPLSESVGAFIEVFGDIGLSAGGPPAHSFDGGFTFLLRRNLQLDLAAGIGLSTAADDWFAGIGVSFRLPH